MKESLKTDRRKEKRDKILAEAGRLFLSNGYSDTKIVDIASACGVAKGTVYEYFSSKDEILAEWSTMLVEKYREAIEPLLEEVSTAEDKLRTFINFKLHYFESVVPTIKLIIESQCFKDLEGKSELKDKLIYSMQFEYNLLKNILTSGIQNGEFAPDVDTDFITINIVSTIAGYVMCKNNTFQIPRGKENCIAYIMDAADKWNEDMLVNHILKSIKADITSA